jgi:hypothetical protein
MQGFFHFHILPKNQVFLNRLPDHPPIVSWISDHFPQ